jgi:hypothetical protein
MSLPTPPPPAALLVSLISAREEWLEEATALLEERFGAVAEASPLLPFTQTAYYAAEFGQPLLRRFLRFERLIPQDTLAQAKLVCLELEAGLASEGRRRVNLDPGLISAERLLLATGKNYTHRVPLSGGIYADLTLIYGRGSFQPLPWTYPDYAGPEIIDLLNRFRAGYIVQLRGAS